MARLFFFPLVGLALLFTLPAARAEPTPKEQDWIERVLLGPGGAQVRACSRWVKKPKLSVFDANPQQTKLVMAAVDQLNEALDGTAVGGIEPVAANSAEADIKVHFASEKTFPDLAKKYEFKYPPGNRGFTWAWWNDKRELDRAVILLAVEMKDDVMRTVALKHVTQALGLLHESPVFTDSIFYKDGKKETTQKDLNVRDRKLIGFLYSRVNPGMNRNELHDAMKKWPKD